MWVPGRLHGPCAAATPRNPPEGCPPSAPAVAPPGYPPFRDPTGRATSTTGSGPRPCDTAPLGDSPHNGQAIYMYIIYIIARPLLLDRPGGDIWLAEMLGRELQHPAVIAQPLCVPQHLLHPELFASHFYLIQVAWTQTSHTLAPQPRRANGWRPRTGVRSNSRNGSGSGGRSDAKPYGSLRHRFKRA